MFDSQVGRYQVSVVITDSNPTQPMSSTYKFNIIVNADNSTDNSTTFNVTIPDKNKTQQKNESNTIIEPDMELTAKITSIKNTWQMIIKFSS